MSSIEKRLTDALAPIGWPIFNSVYAGPAQSYLVIRHSDHPAMPGDDRPGALRILVYVDIFCPLGFNPVATVNAVKRALYSAGMTYPTTEDASDADTRHIVVECEAIGSPELEEPAETSAQSTPPLPLEDSGTAATEETLPAAPDATGTSSSAGGGSRWA